MLMTALRYGHADAAAELVRLGADVHATDNVSMCSPLLADTPDDQCGRGVQRNRTVLDFAALHEHLRASNTEALTRAQVRMCCADAPVIARRVRVPPVCGRCLSCCPKPLARPARIRIQKLHASLHRPLLVTLTATTRARRRNGARPSSRPRR
jgi:hypothetical protein